MLVSTFANTGCLGGSRRAFWFGTILVLMMCCRPATGDMFAPSVVSILCAKDSYKKEKNRIESKNDNFLMRSLSSRFNSYQMG